jgi:hypothetical protein
MKSATATVPNLPATQLSLLPQYSEARQMLERATKFDDVKEIRDRAEAFRSYACAAKDREMEALAGELRLRAERKAGQMLLDARQDGQRASAANGRPKSVSSGNALFAPTLADLGITRLEAHRWMKIAFTSQDAFEQRLAELRGAGVRATTKSFLDADTSETKEQTTPKEIQRAAFNVLGPSQINPVSFTNPGLPLFISPPRESLHRQVDALVQAYACGAVTEAIALVESRTDAAWFSLFVDPVVCFISGGKFPQLKPSAAIYLGNKKRAIFARRFARLGSIWTRIPVANPGGHD